MDIKPTVFLDCGTSWCRAGISFDASESIIPNVVGTPKSQGENLNSKKTYFIGETAVSKSKELSLKFPVEYGHISRWNEMQLMWQALIEDKLGVDAHDHQFLIVQPGNVSRYNLEKTTEIFFEIFGVPSLCFVSSAEMCLLASELHTGTVVEIGGGSCLPVPVVNGRILRHLLQRTEFSGRDLTATLSRMLSKNTELGILDFESVNSIKENYSYCAENYEQECRNFTVGKEINAGISDGKGGEKYIKIGKERFQCPESLFKPSLAMKEFPGLHEIVLKCIISSEDTVQSELFSNIILCGGSSFFPGLASRLECEIKSLAKSQGYRHQVNVTMTPYCHAAFQGAKIASSGGSLSEMSLSKEFYDEYGPNGVSSFFKPG